MIRQYYIFPAVFICGAVVMAFEVLCARILGPFTGTSMFVWASVIGVILTSLSLGYVAGGRIADRKGSYPGLGKIIMAAGSVILLLSFIIKPVISLITGSIADVRIASLLASFLLFALPALLLGMVSPYAARLRIREVQTSGMTVGNLYALSTVGSIAGTLLAGFVLIPAFRISIIMILMSLVLVVTGLMMILTNRFDKISDPEKNEKN